MPSFSHAASEVQAGLSQLLKRNERVVAHILENIESILFQFFLRKPSYLPSRYFMPRIRRKSPPKIYMIDVLVRLFRIKIVPIEKARRDEIARAKARRILS